MQSDIKSNCLQQAAGTGLLQQAAATAGQRRLRNGSNSCKGVAERGYLEKLALWITRKSTFLNLNSSSMNIRENKARIYLKLLKYSTASLHSEPALRLPFGQNPRHHLCSTRPWSSDTETLVFYGFLLDIYSLSMTTWISSSTWWGRWIPIPGHCLVGFLLLYRIPFGILYSVCYSWSQTHAGPYQPEC